MGGHAADDAEAEREASAPTRATAAWFGLIAGPLLALVVYQLLPDPSPDETSLTPAGRATAAIAVWMATWWVTEALPLAATALLPIVLFPLCGVAPVRQATSPYAHELIYLFLGGFMLARALERWGLHRRVALLTLLAVGTQPARLVAGFMLAAAFISMWISNTATTVMMLPIAVSVLSLVGRHAGPAVADDQHATYTSVPDRAPNDLRAHDVHTHDSTAGIAQHDRRSNFATCLMLGVAYGASIGGTATLIGSPPNVFLAGFLESSYDVEVSFGRWMLIGLPLAIVFLPLAWLTLTRVLYPPSAGAVVGGRAAIRNELRILGGMSRGEKTVLVVFLVTATLWMTREPLTQWAWLLGWFPNVAHLSDAGIAVMAALALFALPVHPKRRVFALDWHTARGLPWGALLLFGGGLSLAAAFRSSGLDVWISGPAHMFAGQHVAILIGVVVTLIVFFTELSSNTATAATFLPVLGGVALGVGVHPTLLVVPATLAASCAFMMPVATPPNAIVFGSGHVRIGDMVRAGLLLNVISIVLINVVAHTIVGWVLRR